MVAAAVWDATGKILIAQRPAGKHLAGGWEFPGGKLEPGERRVAGLARELREELGIEVALARARPLMRLRHRYPYGEVLLDMFVVRDYSGVPSGLDGQAVRWCSLAELAEVELLPADRPIVAALWLPECLTAATWERALAARTAGVDFVVLPEPVAAADLAAYCAAEYLPVYARGVTLEEAWALGATGVCSHLPPIGLTE